MSDFKEWAMARKAQGPNGEAASGIQTSAGNPRPPAAQASGTTPFKEWAMQRKAQSLTGKERIAETYQQTNAGQTARKNAARPQITTPYTVHLDQVNTPQEQFDTAVRRLKTLYQHQNDLASRSATMDPAEYSRQWNETQKQVGQMEALKTSAANQRYRQKNEAALAQINADASLSSDYRSTENIQSDLDKITAIADDAMNHNGGAEIVEYKTELAEKYGLTQQAIDNYAIGGADYHPAGSGITNLWQLYEQLDAQRQEKVKSLQDRGYDYERLQAYKKEKRDAGEYAVQSRQWQQYAEEHPWLASLETTLVSPFQGIDFARTAVQGIRHGNPEDEENYVPLNLYNMDATNFVSQVRGQVSKNLGEKYDLEIFDQNVAQFLYHTGMSIADSALLIATMGSGAGLLMGTSAAANGTRDAVERGASSSQAILTGLAQGAAELIFEKFSIDQLLKPKNVQSVRRLLQETLKQAGVEASEEGATEIANILTDAAIMGESSNFSISVENYKAQGMSESEARKQAYLDMIGQVGWAAAGGALSGGVMGGFVNTARLGLGNQTENTAEPGTDRQGQARQKMAQPNVIQSNSGMPWAESDTAQSTDSRLEQSQQKQSEARFSIQYDRDNNPYVLVEDDILEGVPRNEWVRTVKDNLRQRFPNGVTVGNNVININQQSRREMTFSNYMKQLFWQEPQLYSDKLRATNNADEILQASRNWVNEALLHRRKDTITDFARGEVLLRIGNNDYRAQVVVGNRGNGNLLLYDIINLAPTEIQLHKTKVDAADTTNTPKEPRGRQTASTRFNVAQDGSGVNGDLAFRQTGERTELSPLRSRDDNTNSSSGVLWAGSDTSQSADADSSPQGEPLMRRVAFSGAAKPGLVKDQTYRKARYTAKTERTLDTIAKAAGVQVRIVDRVDVQDADGNVVGDANARYIPETATIEISRSTQDPVRAVFVHEVVHRIRDAAPEAYTQMAKYVVDTMDENRYTDAIDTRAEWYRTNDASYLQEEVVADAFGRVLSDSAALDRFVQSNRNIAQRILDALQDFIDAIRGRTGDGKLSDAKAQEVQEFVDFADEMVRLLEHALKRTDGPKNTSSMGGKAKHSLNADFGRQFDAWLSQNNEQQRLRSNGYFLVGTTSDALKSIGIDDYRIYFGQGKIAKIMQKHPAMTAEVIKSVPDILEHPVLVMQSQTVANRITLFGETVDANGKPVLVALELSPQNKRGEVLDFVVITSAYGKNNAQHLIDASDILYIDPDKKRTNSWLRLLRLQLPSRVTSYGSIQRVTLLNRDVNGNLTFGERGGKTDMQLAFEKAMAEKRRTRFSLKTPIEGSADLIALHNLTEQNLLDALRLGGMPMPSIAVTKTDLPHLEFGDITLVLDKNSIDPGADSRNRVYGADIGSSIAPEEAQTLEEIVEAMKQSRRLPEGVGAMSLQAAVAPSYESLQQLWQDSGRLGRMEGPEFQADLEAVNRQIEEILREVRQGQVDAEAADAAVALRNAAGSTKTEQAIAQSFAEDGYALDSKLVAQIQAAFQAAAELPTEYFEAKPERVVGFDEVLAAVVPDSCSEELMERLKEAGVRTLQYLTDDNADRVEQVNSVQQARFSPGSAQKRTGRTNSDSGVIWAGSDTSQSASRPAPLRRSQSNSSSGVLWRGSETAMDSPDQAVYNEAGKGQSTSSSNSSSGILWAGSDAVEFFYDSRKIGKQMEKRGWTEALIQETIRHPTKTVKTRDTRWLPGADRPLDDPATAYYASDGSYIVRNDQSGAIAQISNKNDPNWIAPWDMPDR